MMDKSYTVAVPKEQEALKQHIAFNYPRWKLVDYVSKLEGGTGRTDRAGAGIKSGQ